MAIRDRAVPDNVPGSFFVDDSCIDCDTCRQVAPQTFISLNGFSAVICQPESAQELIAAARAVICCPTASIGSDHPDFIKHAQDDFPLALTDQVWYGGWTSHHSFGASSYLIHHRQERWLIDAPRWSPALVRGIERLGGLTGIFLTHRDDVADAARYAAHFQAPRFIHARDAEAMPEAEHIIHATTPHELSPGLHCLPVPGHTAGSMALFTDSGHLFSGDHVWWSPLREALNASIDYCWFDWPTQIASMRLLLNYPITSLFPGHGRRYHASVSNMRNELSALVTRMKNASRAND